MTRISKAALKGRRKKPGRATFKAGRREIAPPRTVSDGGALEGPKFLAGLREMWKKFFK